ncbi:MAG: general secretion pathway protein B [Pseudohongiellaceae bacterium]|jgi:general secretion pathway protein B
MSYILDALKRSEQERQQDKMPSFSTESMIIQTNQNKTHRWPYVLILVLIINALVLFFYNSDTLKVSKAQTMDKGVRPEALTDLEETTSAVSPAVSSINQRRAPPSSVVKERQYIKPLTQPTQKSRSSDWPLANSNEERANDHLYGTTVEGGLLIKPKAKPQPKQKTPSFDTPKGNIKSTEALIQINPSYGSAHKGYSAGQSEPVSPSHTSEQDNNASLSTDDFANVPLLTSLGSSFQRSIPALAFNSHIYSRTPSQRRVMINNFYLKEGQSFDGLELIEIGEAFIKVSKSSTIFKLPVLRDWGK